MKMTGLLIEKAKKQFHNVCVKVQEDTFIVFSCEHTLYASWFIRGGYRISLIGHVKGRS